MGAYLFFKVQKKGDIDKVNDLLALYPEQKKLEKGSNQIWVCDSEQVIWAKEESKKTGKPHWYSHYKKELGRGDWKASGLDYRSGERVYELVTRVFEKLQKAIPMKIYSRSCALKTDYFSPEQMARITKNGDRLSSTPKDSTDEILAVIKRSK